MTNCIGLRKLGIASAIFALGAAALVATSPARAQDKSIRCQCTFQILLRLAPLQLVVSDPALFFLKGNHAIAPELLGVSHRGSCVVNYLFYSGTVFENRRNANGNSEAHVFALDIH